MQGLIVCGSKSGPKFWPNDKKEMAENVFKCL